MLNCPRCGYFDPGRNYCKVMLTSVPGICPYADERPRTRYDEIVRKSPEELAEWLAGLIAPRGDGKPVARKKRILKWLKEEVTDDD